MFSGEDENIFNKEETDLLAKTRKVRLEMIEDMTDDGMPHKSGDIRVLNETLDAMDRQVLDVVKIKAKQKEDDGADRIANIVVQILNNVGSNGPQIISNREIDLPDEYIPLDIVPGETDITPETLALSNFIMNNEDEL